MGMKEEQGLSFRAYVFLAFPKPEEEVCNLRASHVSIPLPALPEITFQEEQRDPKQTTTRL